MRGVTLEIDIKDVLAVWAVVPGMYHNSPYTDSGGRINHFHYTQRSPKVFHKRRTTGKIMAQMLYIGNWVFVKKLPLQLYRKYSKSDISIFKKEPIAL